MKPVRERDDSAEVTRVDEQRAQAERQPTERRSRRLLMVRDSARCKVMSIREFFEEIRQS
jgi:hypothetical protein